LLTFFETLLLAMVMVPINRHRRMAQLGCTMIDDVRGRIDYDEHGVGPTVVLVPGSCSTGAAWRDVMAAWQGRFRCITTSLLGYGETAERRSAADPGMSHEVEMLEMVIHTAGVPVHLVGHSFGGLVSLAVALRNRLALASLAIVEAPAAELLRDRGEHDDYAAFRTMTAAYFAAFDRGEKEAIAAMIDFYGGAGTFASWPPRVRAYAIETTPVNVLDWATAYGFALSAPALARVAIPLLVLTGGASHPAVQHANRLLSSCMNGKLITLDGAAHFMVATHATEVARCIAQHVDRAEARRESLRAIGR
jgi:pimeloyl-ACP methyl ester carboxylesterase